MQKIFELDPHVADLIAAGEVVEKPASVVKELMENSIDADARIITVEIKDGGMTFIRVSDDGIGISADDVETAFKRHATSKIRDAQSLEAIGTLGFRGEALAAISAVSRIELTSRERGEPSSTGVRLSLEAGVTQSLSPVGCPEGTTIVVRDLFFNTPARLKFLKSNRAESSAVASAVLRCALSHPEVSVRFIKDGKTEYHTPGDSRVDSCIYSLFGRDFASDLVPAEVEDEVKVIGFVSKPNASRGSRSFQFFFVNGRPIRSKSLGTALEQAYANLIPSGRFPACILYLSTSPGNVDVNIHPTKAEVKFVSEKQAFSAVYYATLGAVAPSVRDPLSSDNNASIAAAPQFGASFKAMTVEDFRQEYKPAKNVSSSLPRLDNKSIKTNQKNFTSLFSQDDDVKNSDEANTETYAEPESSTAIEPFDKGSSLRVIGEALKTYIIIEKEDSLWIIDKHAAHERIHFNSLKSGNHDPMSQSLIVPIICRFGNEDIAALLDNITLLDELGFSLEGFGEDSVAIRRIPSELDIGDIESVLSQICEALSSGGILDSERLDSIYRSIACGSSIKAGSLTSLFELEALAKRVLSGEITNCPHGRPVMFELSKAVLDKEFKRI